MPFTFLRLPKPIERNRVVMFGHRHARIAGITCQVSSFRPNNESTCIRVSFEDGKVTIFSDLRSAYEPEVGVEKFTRRFTFTSPGAFLIEDEIKTSKPRKIVSYLHSDNAIVKSGSGFEFEPGNPNLLVELIEPSGLDAIIEKNILTAPGRPGSVDKGEREERGVRLAISPKQAVSTISMKSRLTIK